MADLIILEPYAVVQHWHLPEADGYWENILAEYLQTLAKQCSSVESCVIGHIKALALLPDKSYFRVNVVAPNITASIGGKIPSGCTDLKLTLNVLVYGLERTVIEQITHETAKEVAKRWKGDVSHHNLNQAGQHLHNFHHQDQKE